MMSKAEREAIEARVKDGFSDSNVWDDRERLLADLQRLEVHLECARDDASRYLVRATKTEARLAAMEAVVEAAKYLVKEQSGGDFEPNGVPALKAALDALERTKP